MHVIIMIDTIDNNEVLFPIKERLIVEALVAVIMNLDNDGIDEYYEMVSALIGRDL